MIKKIHNCWLAFSCCLITFLFSIRAIVSTCIFRSDRSYMSKMLRLWSQWLLNIVKLSFTVHNPNNFTFDPNTKYIIMTNHASHFDIPLMLLAFDVDIRMVAKKELFRVPVWGRAMRVTEFIPINRNNRHEALQDLEFAKQKMASGIKLWMAPEGTRSRTGALSPFKKGGFMLALQSGATIVPIGIRGSFHVLPPKTINFNLRQHVDIVVGSPIDTTQYPIDNRDKLMQDVRARLIELANLPKE